GGTVGTIWATAGHIRNQARMRQPVGLALEQTYLSGDNMLNMIRLTALAAALLVAVTSAVVPQAAQAQAQPPAPTAPAAPPEPATATPAPAAPAAPAGGTRVTEVIENPYGLEAMWKGGDIVASITLGVLVIMSR